MPNYSWFVSATLLLTACHQDHPATDAGNNAGGDSNVNTNSDPNNMTGNTNDTNNTGGDGNATNNIADSNQVGDPNGLQVDVFVLADWYTCVIGDACTGGACVMPVAGAGLQFVNNANLRFVVPSDPNVQKAGQSICLHPAMSASDQNAVHATLDTNFLGTIAADTNIGLPLKVYYHTLSGVNLSMTALVAGTSWYVAPSDAAAVILPLLSKKTAFTVVTTGTYDPQTGKRVIPACAATQTGDALGGAGYTWVAKTTTGFTSDCATPTNFIHEWEHQLAWGINHISGFTSVYPTGYPGCTTTHNPNQWFPDSNDCVYDPDYGDCGKTACGSADAFDDHVLNAHWVTGRRTITNHCVDGVQNYSETAVDVGGDCPR